MQATARVVIVDPSSAPTGALRAAMNIAQALAPDVATTLVLAKSAEVENIDLSMFAHVLRVPMRQIRRSIVDLALYGPSLLAAVFALRRLLRADDVLIVNDIYLLHGWLLRRLGWRGRIVTWVRIDPLSFPAPLRRIWLAALRTSADAIVAVSSFIGGRLRDEGIESRLLYDPVDRLMFTGNTTDRLPTRRIVQIANFTRGKGQNDAISAFARVGALFPDAHLIFHGGVLGNPRNHAYLSELRQQAMATGLAERIAFCGFARDVGRVLAAASVALMLSHRESFSLSCLEASQAGVPVIATRCGGPAEIVEDQQTGILCNIGDVTGIADAMCRLLADPTEATAMGARGATLVQQRFSPNLFAVMLRRLLLQDIHGTRQGRSLH